MSDLAIIAGLAPANDDEVAEARERVFKLASAESKVLVHEGALHAEYLEVFMAEDVTDEVYHEVIGSLGAWIP